MIAEQIYQTNRIDAGERQPYRESLSTLLFEMCGGRKIYDLDLFAKAISKRMYWWFPVLSEIQEEHISL